MLRSTLGPACFCVALVLAASALAADPVPNLRGEWSGEAMGISFGDPKAGVAVNDSAKPIMMPNKVTVTVEVQDGRHLAGFTKHNYGQDRFVAMVRADNRTVYGADAEGSLNGVLLSDNEMELCYSEHTKMRAFVSCWTMVRAARP